MSNKYTNLINEIINIPLIIIPSRVIWLIGRIMIYTLASFGAYQSVIISESGIHTLEEWKEVYLGIFIISTFAEIMIIYIFYDILSTIYNIYNDISKTYNYKLSIKIEKRE